MKTSKLLVVGMLLLTKMSFGRSPVISQIQTNCTALDGSAYVSLNGTNASSTVHFQITSGVIGPLSQDVRGNLNWDGTGVVYPANGQFQFQLYYAVDVWGRLGLYAQLTSRFPSHLGASYYVCSTNAPGRK